ncbi:hypothetical protein ENUP19_0009G0036 [Entamoeba nuttalli]|uniref:G-patch domain containing protein n=2 Tax=Entamoeba nuttalli TaxID=412467 RepID=K2G3J9_ENTNP|nr:G-patch domain containing protein [Entamoeba nuttalli P19]EKE36896.1 G-patch domain containing protein [Entamoeba nuttalli P19]|eukprot:XP_008860761.1 G-patch domain containing protein [Entamoeba nuttalli P19]
MDLNDPMFSLFVSQLEATGWRRGKGLGKNEDGITSIEIKANKTGKGIGASRVTENQKLDDVYAGKIEDHNDVQFVQSKEEFDKYSTNKDEEKKPKKEETNILKKKVDVIEATSISMKFGRGRRQKGKLLRIQEQEKRLLNKEVN